MLQKIDSTYYHFLKLYINTGHIANVTNLNYQIKKVIEHVLSHYGKQN